MNFLLSRQCTFNAKASFSENEIKRNVLDCHLLQSFQEQAYSNILKILLPKKWKYLDEKF